MQTLVAHCSELLNLDNNFGGIWDEQVSACHLHYEHQIVESREMMIDDDYNT